MKKHLFVFALFLFGAGFTKAQSTTDQEKKSIDKWQWYRIESTLLLRQEEVM